MPQSETRRTPLGDGVTRFHNRMRRVWGLATGQWRTTRGYHPPMSQPTVGVALFGPKVSVSDRLSSLSEEQEIG